MAKKSDAANDAANKEEILFFYPCAPNSDAPMNADDFAQYWAAKLGGGDDLCDRIKSALKGDEIEALCGEDEVNNGAPLDAASEHFFFLRHLSFLARHADQSASPPVLPIEADVDANPIARLAIKGNPLARRVYKCTSYEYQWPKICSEQEELVRDALTFIESVCEGLGVEIKDGEFTDDFKMLFGLPVNVIQAPRFRFAPFARFWRRAHFLEV